MKMQAEEFGDLADELLTHKALLGCNNALRRTCIGRYYYQTFHIVQNWLITNHNSVLENMSGTTHARLRSCCEQLSEKLNNQDFEKLAMKLKALHDLRTRSDYQLDQELREGDLTTVTIEKDRAIALVNKLISQYAQAS